MIDRQSRDALATFIEAFCLGKIDGPSLLRAARNLASGALSVGGEDPAIDAVCLRLHQYIAEVQVGPYLDAHRFGAEYADQLTRDQLSEVARCAAFLRSDRALAWPRSGWDSAALLTHPPDPAVIALFLGGGLAGMVAMCAFGSGLWAAAGVLAPVATVLGIAGMGLARRDAQRQPTEEGDVTAFPFLSHAEVAEAVERDRASGRDIRLLAG